jgi:hypothetical protein
MFGIFGDPIVATEVGGVFGSAAGDIRGRANRSIDAEEQGERATREDSYTDEFVDQMRGSISEKLSGLAQRLSNTGIKVEIDFHATNLPVSDETGYGADIGIRATLRTPEAEVTKGILVQCKRMYGPASNPSYKELPGRGEKQAKDMLRITPASFFMLHNFGSQRDLLNWSSVPTSTLCPMDKEGTIASLKRVRIADQCPIWAVSTGGIWDMGISMLPATRVLALSTSAASRGAKLPHNVSIILRGCLPLGVFMADLLGACFVGDVREEVIRIVTPPKLRQPPTIPTALFAFDNYMVRHHINLTVSMERGTL